MPHVPTSRLAIWARRCALFSLAATVSAIIIVRAGLIELAPSLAALAGALGFAALAILLALMSLVVIWREGLAGLGQALLALTIGAALLAYPAYLGAWALRTPAITDVTTDASDPPRFDLLSRQRPRGAIDHPDSELAALQRAAYPDIEPLQVAAGAQSAYAAALATVNKRKWRVVLDRPPQPGRHGQIEAVARTPILGLREDVVVRVRGSAQGARIDVRSTSRHGRHDFGSNAARVRRLLSDIGDAVSARADESKKPPLKPRNR